MKASELISILENLNPNEDIYFLPENSRYPEDFSSRVRTGVTLKSFYGTDRQIAILVSGEQVGGI